MRGLTAFADRPDDKRLATVLGRIRQAVQRSPHRFSRLYRVASRLRNARSGVMQLAFTLEHDLFGKPVSTFPDRALVRR
jgi:hypothetical protein